jgi:hypothetical protein
VFFEEEFKYAFEGTKSFEDELNGLCAKVVLDKTVYTACLNEVTDEVALKAMNDNYKAHLTAAGKASTYAPFKKVDTST